MIRLDKADYARALLTDTSPSDVPIVFSNDGFYINYREAKNAPIGFNFVKSLLDKINSEKPNSTIPFEYKIYKTEVKFRTLALIHPAYQIKYAEIYKEYSPAIIYLCSKSKFSIRSPRRVSNSLYINDVSTNYNYKEFNIDTIYDEIHKKHANSYFSYSGFDRAYKFYSSPLFIKLEKIYPVMWKLDISNCFDSIYTHSISWAIKNRAFIKSNLAGQKAHQFCDRLDHVMQYSNNAETNGIPIGSEFSRIFAEVILQSIDQETEHELESEHRLSCRIDYTILRYVDDYFLFAKTEEAAKKVALILAERLSCYNLYLNEGKLEKLDRPFITKRTSILASVDHTINGLIDSLYSISKLDNTQLISVKQIRSRSKLTNDFIRRIKVNLSVYDGDYSDISSFLISILSKRIERITHSKIEIIDEHDTPIRIRDCICTLIEIIFFFYTTSPSVTASNRVARAIVVADHYLSRKHPTHLAFFRSEVMSHIQDVIQTFEKELPNNYIYLEKLNILLATAEFGDEHSLPIDHFNYIKTANMNYFEIICLLYYFRGRSKYSQLTEHLEQAVLSMLENIKFISKSSEHLHLFLDVLSCPHVSSNTRLKLFEFYLAVYEPTIALAPQQKQELIELMLERFWFVKWNDLNLLNLLERKELRATY